MTETKYTLQMLVEGDGKDRTIKLTEEMIKARQEEWEKMTPEQREVVREARQRIALKPHNELLQRIKTAMPALEEELEKANSDWGGEDLFYRYYHHSFKVYSIQSYTNAIVKLLQSLAPEGHELNADFMDIIKRGIGKNFEHEHNQRWAEETRPLLEAFFHAREMLKFAIKYGKELQEAEGLLKSGWAAVLYLYNLR